MAGAFINYRSSDEAYGALLIDRMLVARFGEDLVFRDSRSIPVGTDFPPLLWSALNECHVLIVVIGPNWLERDAAGQRRIDDAQDYVRREIAETMRRGIPILPVLIDDTRLPTVADLPDDIAGLARRQYRHVRVRSAEHDIARIVADIEAWMPRQAPAPEPATPPAAPTGGPWIGSIDGPVTFGNNSPAIAFGDGATRRTEP